MRVLFLNSVFFYYTAQLANGLACQGHEGLFVGWRNSTDFDVVGGPDPQAEFAKFLHPNLAVDWIDIPEKTRPRTILANLKCIWQIVKAIRRYKPDLIHIHDMADYRFVIAMALVRRSYPIVITVHNAEPHPGKKKQVTEFMRSWLRRMADAVMVHGDDVKTRLMALSSISEDKIFQAPIGAYVFQRQWRTGRAADKHMVLFFGAIVKYKGLEYMIKAAPIVLQEIPDAKFVIAGSGPDWARCKLMIENFDAFILYEDTITNREITPLFEEAAVVALPYIEASQSAVLAVAYALERPVITTDVGCLPEVVDHGKTGLIVPAGDVKALADAIIYLLSNPDICAEMGVKAYEKAQQGDLNWEVAASKTAKAYEFAIQSRQSGRR